MQMGRRTVAFRGDGCYVVRWKEERIMATSSITANFHCDDAKAANAFVRMLARPVGTVPLDPVAARARGFASAEEERAFCLNTVEVARKALSKPRRPSPGRRRK